MADIADQPLWSLPATRIAALVRAGELSAVEVAKSALARIEAVNPTINAVVESRPEEVLAAAAAVDAVVAGGGDPGPLAGVPVTIKVNVARSPEEAEMQEQGIDVMAAMFEESRDTSGFTEKRDPNLEPGEIASDEDEAAEAETTETGEA